MTKHQQTLDIMFELIDSDSLDTAELAKQLMKWMGTIELERFVKVHEYDTIWTELQAEE